MAENDVRVRHGRLGAALVVVPTNDWEAIRHYHLDSSVFRAIENGMSLVRQTDAGLSIAVDPYGRVLAQTDFFGSTDRTMVAQVPVKHVATIRLGNLKEIEPQKERIQRNTEQFVNGQPANNVLLTGARGTGKSSLIKACLNEFAPQGLRLIEVDKADLVDLPDIVELVAERPERFVVYCDDLSFDEGEPGYKALKVMLDGSIAGAAGNVLIYATSTRRHLLHLGQ